MSDFQSANEAFEQGHQGQSHDHAVWPSFETLSAYSDGELQPSEEALVAVHLETCAFCRAVIEDIELLSNVTRSAQAPAPGRSFRLTAETPGIRLPSIQSQPPVPLAPPVSIESRQRTPNQFLPYVTAIAAILLLAVFTADLFSRHDTPPTSTVTSPPAVLIIDGTAFTEDDSSSIRAAGLEPTSQNPTSADQPIGANPAVAQSPIAANPGDSGRFWTGWRLVELLLGLTVACLLVTMFRGRSSRNR
jgi:putative zinc finger protein